LFDAFEYFKCIYDNSKDKDKIYLIYIYSEYTKYNQNMNINGIRSIIKDKYDVSDTIFTNVLFLNASHDVIRYKFNKVLMLDNHTTHMLRDYLLAKKYLIILDPAIPSKTDYNKESKRDNHYCFSEYLLYNWGEKDELSI